MGGTHSKMAGKVEAEKEIGRSPSLYVKRHGLYPKEGEVIKGFKEENNVKF